MTPEQEPTSKERDRDVDDEERATSEGMREKTLYEIPASETIDTGIDQVDDTGAPEEADAQIY